MDRTYSTRIYDTLVMIGRYEPYHCGHQAVIHKALDLADYVLILIGSAFEPRTFKNPFTCYEREIMIRDSFVGIDRARLKFAYVQDRIYNETLWLNEVQWTVESNSVGKMIGVIGHEKDESSYYLKMFPQWGLESIEQIEVLNATDIRDLYFREDVNMNYLKAVIPDSTYEFLDGFRKTEEYQQIILERRFIETYRKQYEHLRYPPIFVTADAVVVQSGHVLLVERRSEPGKGLFAFPGGYVNADTDKSVTSAMIRELREETGLKVPEPVLTGNIKEIKVFDAIKRSPRGRIITHAHYVKLPDTGPLPKVTGGDDAARAFWSPLSEVSSEDMFEDHAHILSYFTGI